MYILCNRTRNTSQTLNEKKTHVGLNTTIKPRQETHTHYSLPYA